MRLTRTSRPPVEKEQSVGKVEKRKGRSPAPFHRGNRNGAVPYPTCPPLGCARAICSNRRCRGGVAGKSRGSKQSAANVSTSSGVSPPPQSRHEKVRQRVAPGFR